MGKALSGDDLSVSTVLTAPFSWGGGLTSSAHYVMLMFSINVLVVLVGLSVYSGVRMLGVVSIIMDIEYNSIYSIYIVGVVCLYWCGRWLDVLL